MSLSSKPATRHCPLLVCVSQIYVEVTIEFYDDFSELHHSKILADAVSCPCSKLLTTLGYLRITGGREPYSEHIRPHSRYIFWIALYPSLGPKFVRVLPKDAFVAVNDPAVYTNDGVSRNMHPMQSDATFGAAAFQNEPGTGVNPESLVGNS